MTDTQWQRFEVFMQGSQEAPLEHAGSVHAADSEIALMNARDVFVRRPRCSQLFVAPSEEVVFRTREQLEMNGDCAEVQQSVSVANDSSPRTFLVLAKAGHRGSLKAADRVEACSAIQAVRIAIERLGIERSSFWAAVAEESMVGNQFADAESLFAPAEAKNYRMHSDFPVNKMMRERKAKS